MSFSSNCPCVCVCVCVCACTRGYVRVSPDPLVSMQTFSLSCNASWMQNARVLNPSSYHEIQLKRQEIFRTPEKAEQNPGIRIIARNIIFPFRFEYSKNSVRSPIRGIYLNSIPFSSPSYIFDRVIK